MNDPGHISAKSFILLGSAASLKQHMGYTMDFMLKVPWIVLIVACLTLGLAPFNPPHVYEKLVMLFKGDLKRFIDWFDLVLHASPWVLLILKSISAIRAG
jgi:hypothetical protein